MVCGADTIARDNNQQGTETVGQDHLGIGKGCEATQSVLSYSVLAVHITEPTLASVVSFESIIMVPTLAACFRSSGRPANNIKGMWGASRQQ